MCAGVDPRVVLGVGGRGVEQLTRAGIGPDCHLIAHAAAHQVTLRRARDGVACGLRPPLVRGVEDDGGGPGDEERQQEEGEAWEGAGQGQGRHGAGWFRFVAGAYRGALGSFLGVARRGVVVAGAG